MRVEDRRNIALELADAVAIGLFAGIVGLHGELLNSSLGGWIGLAIGGVLGGLVVQRARLLLLTGLAAGLPALVTAFLIPTAACLRVIGVALFAVLALSAVVITPAMGIVAMKARPAMPMRLQPAISIAAGIAAITAIAGWAALFASVPFGTC